MDRNDHDKCIAWLNQNQEHVLYEFCKAAHEYLEKMYSLYTEEVLGQYYDLSNYPKLQQCEFFDLAEQALDLAEQAKMKVFDLVLEQVNKENA